jgi:NADPH-dependent F420 reductase
MTEITIVGAGNMARGIGTRALAGGHSVTVVHPDPDKAQALVEGLRATAPEGAAVTAARPQDELSGEIVVLAVPYEAVAEIVEAYGDGLRGRVLVDISNPIDWGTLDLLTPESTSAAEETAALVPDGTHVVKAFNTTFASTLADGEVSGKPVDVFIAGEDEEARSKVAELAASGGLRPLDVGALRRARELEAMQLIHIRLQPSLGTGYGSTLKILA